jgi:hypothetical protein
VWLVLRRNGRLGEYLAGPVDYRSARSFRWRTIPLAMTPPLLVIGGVIAFAAVAGGEAILGKLEEMVVVVGEVAARERPMVALLGLPLLWVGYGLLSAFSALAIMVGVVNWFFNRRGLGAEQQNRCIALSYYTCAPLALMPLVALLEVLAVPVVAWFAYEAASDSAASVIAAAAAFGLPALVVVYWWLVVVCAVRSVARRSPRVVVFTAAALPVVWLGVGLIFWVVVPMGFLMLTLVPGLLD